MSEAERPDAPTSTLYRELPFPGDGVIRRTVAKMLRQGIPRHAPHLVSRRPLEVVDLGCGTGELTCGIARHLPGARVVGVDVNPASLDLARSLARRARLDVKFVHGDVSHDLRTTLLASDAMPESGAFDLACAMGVLHHLSEPSLGFTQARTVVKDDGLLLAYVYSRFGRWDDLAVRALLDRAVPRDASFADRARAIRQLRLSRKHGGVLGFLSRLADRWRFGPALDVSELVRVFLRRDRLVQVSDTFSNPCEHLFDFRELEELCENAGWSRPTLAKGGGLPVTATEHSRDTAPVSLLMPRDLFHDYLAFRYRADGFVFFLEPGTRVARP